MAYVARRGCSSPVTNQMNVILPPEAFNNPAVNPWLGIAVGIVVGAIIVSRTR